MFTLNFEDLIEKIVMQLCVGYFVFAVGSIRVKHICENTFQPILKFCLESKLFRTSKKLDQNSIFTIFFPVDPSVLSDNKQSGSSECRNTVKQVFSLNFQSKQKSHEETTFTISQKYRKFK